MDSVGAVVIGGSGRVAMLGAQQLLEKVHIDDGVGSIPMHLAEDPWGTVAIALVGDPQILGAGRGLEGLSSRL